jgi:MoaA/NifB/PqqE/SkfB family radical SAM enzyme
MANFRNVDIASRAAGRASPIRTVTHEPVPGEPIADVGRTDPGGPVLPFGGLDTLWLQVTGTVCNIACLHCFITCGPKNTSHPVMATEQIFDVLRAAREYGVRDYYFTGGEPFLHPDILLLIERTLEQGPLSILTNGILIDKPVAEELGALFRRGPYSLDLRVSIDGLTPEDNDPIRGHGTYDQIMRGAWNLMNAGVNPVFTVTTVHATYEENAGRLAFIDALRKRGFERPRVKFIPPFKIGREARRSGAYEPGHVLRAGDLFEGEEDTLLCGSSRTVTAKGVYPCPILIEEQGAKMGESLAEGMRRIRLNHPACVTCHVEGFSCRT